MPRSKDDEGGTTPKNENGNSKDEQDELLKKLSTFYSLILFFAFLTDSKVASLDDILKTIGSNEANRRIARNVGIGKEVLLAIRSIINPFVLSDLDYKISHMNQLSHDKSVPANERVERAMKKFGRLSTSEVVTPTWVADKMVAYLPANRIKKQEFLI